MPIRVPAVAAALLRALLHGAERDEVMADAAEEYALRAGRGGELRARLWLWRQVIGSVPAAVGRIWFRGTTGFESEANRMKSGGSTVESWILDIRFALRGLRSRPQYVLLSVLTLALGIGGTTAVFAIARVLLLNALPYAASDELVMFWNPHDWSEAEIAHLRVDWPGFAGVAGYYPRGVFMKQEGAPAQMVPVVVSSAELFDVLGTRPQLGRGFEGGDDGVGAEPKVVLSHGFWQDLGGSRDVIGRMIELDGVSRRVVGVMPAGFWFPDPSIRAWLTVPMRPDNQAGNYALVGRREPGRSIPAMADPVSRLTTRLSEQFEYPAQWDKTQNAELIPLRDYLLGPVRPALLATLAGMGVILLMACANVATLMLGQLRGRSSELAVRMALGAGRRRLMQQLIVESGLLGLLAGLAGAVVAAAGFTLLLAALPLGELADAVAPDWTLFVTALAIAVVAALLIALAPVFSLWRGDLRDTLSRARSGGVGAHGGRLEDALVVGEVALAVLLAASAAVLIRSVDYLSAIDPGIETRGVAVIDVTFSGVVPADQRGQQLAGIIERLESLAGVSGAAAVQRLPLRQGDNWGISIQSKPGLEASTTAFRIVSRDYFAVMGIGVRSGRVFEETDRAGSDPVMVIDENLARTYFGGEDPIGQYIASGARTGQQSPGGASESWMRVIGVVENVAHAGLTAEEVPGRYALYDQLHSAPQAASLVLRVESGRNAAGVLQQAVRTIGETTTSVAVQEATTMQNVYALSMGPTRRTMQLLTLLGALALTLGAVGVYGVVSQFVTRRRRDWVIRMALGMTPATALQQVVGRGVLLVGTGCVLGIGAALALTRLLASLLYGVGAADPLALVAAVAALIATGCVAALVPGMRATRINPAQALRDA